MNTARDLSTIDTQTIESIVGTFISKQHGHQMAYKILKQKNSEKTQVVHLFFCHGAVEYHERHLDFLRHFFKHPQYDFVLYTFDLVGHGHSGGSRAYVENFEYYCQDYIQFLDVIKEQYKANPLQQDKFFLGSHSLGGLISLKLLMDYRSKIPFEISGAFFSNPCIKTKLKVPQFLQSFMGKIHYGMEKIRVPSFQKAEEISTIPSLGKSFFDDPLISNFMTIGMAREILKQTKKTQGLSYHIDTPCLFLLSPNDAIVDYEASKLFTKCIDKSLVKVQLYSESAHDLFNDRQATNVEDDIKKWLESFYS